MPLMQSCILVWTVYAGHVVSPSGHDDQLMHEVWVQGTCGGVWHRHQLLTISATSVHCIFVAAGPEFATPFAEVG